MAQWKHAIGALAEEFTSGIAQVEVFDSGSFQFQNYLLPLNRWHEESDINTELLDKSTQ